MQAPSLDVRGTSANGDVGQGQAELEALASTAFTETHHVSSGAARKGAGRRETEAEPRAPSRDAWHEERVGEGRIDAGSLVFHEHVGGASRRSDGDTNEAFVVGFERVTNERFHDHREVAVVGDDHHVGLDRYTHAPFDLREEGRGRIGRLDLEERDAGAEERRPQDPSELDRPRARGAGEGVVAELAHDTARGRGLVPQDAEGLHEGGVARIVGVPSDQIGGVADRGERTAHAMRDGLAERDELRDARDLALGRVAAFARERAYARERRSVGAMAS